MTSSLKPTYLEAVKHAPLKRGEGNTGSKLSAPTSHLAKLKNQLANLIIKLRETNLASTTRLNLKAEYQALESAFQSERNRLMRARRRADFNHSKKAINKKLSLDPRDYVFGDLKTVNYLLEYSRKHFTTEHVVHKIFGAQERRKYWRSHPKSKAVVVVKRHRNPYYVFDNGEDPSGGTKINPDSLVVNKPIAPETLPGFSEYKSRRQRRRERGVHYVIDKIVTSDPTLEAAEPISHTKEVPRTHRRISHAIQQTQYQKAKDKRITIQSKRQANRLRYASLPQNVRDALRTPDGRRIPELQVKKNPLGNARSRRNDSRRHLQQEYKEKSSFEPHGSRHAHKSQINGANGEATNSDDVSDYAYIVFAPIALYCVKKIYHTACRYFDMDIPTPPTTPVAVPTQLNGANGEYSGTDDVTNRAGNPAHLNLGDNAPQWASCSIRSCACCLSYDLCLYGVKQCACGLMCPRSAYYAIVLRVVDSVPMQVVYIPSLQSALYVEYGLVSNIDGEYKHKHVRGLTRCVTETGEVYDTAADEHTHPPLPPGGVQTLQPSCTCRICFSDVSVDYYSLDPDVHSSLNGSHGEYTMSDDVETAKATVVADNKRTHKEAKNKRNHASLTEHKPSKKFQALCLHAVAAVDGQCTKTGCKYNHDTHLIRDKQREGEIIKRIQAKQKSNGVVQSDLPACEPTSSKPPADTPMIGGESCAVKLALQNAKATAESAPPAGSPPVSTAPDRDVVKPTNNVPPPQESPTIFVPKPAAQAVVLDKLKHLARSEVKIFGTSNESWLGMMLRYIAGFQLPACFFFSVWLAVSIAQLPSLPSCSIKLGVYILTTLVLLVTSVVAYTLGLLKYNYSFVPQEFTHGGNNVARSAARWQRCTNWHSKREPGIIRLFCQKIIQLLECNNYITRWIFRQYGHHLEPEVDRTDIDIDALAAIGYNMHRVCEHYPEVTKSTLAQYSKYGHTEKTLEQMYIWANTTFPSSEYDIDRELLNNSVVYAYNQYRVSKFHLSLSDPEAARKINFF